MMNANLADLFETVVDTIPDNLALVAGRERLSFAELDQRANRLANHLLAQGTKDGDKIGIYAYNRAQWVEAMLAAFKIRAVPININYRYVEEELIYLFDNAELSTVIFERRFAPLLTAIKPQLPYLDHAIVLDDSSMADCATLQAVPYRDIQRDGDATRPDITRSGDDLYILFTGGTTGLPKGAVWRHQDIFYGALQGGNPGGEPLNSTAMLTEKLRTGAAMTTVAPAPMMHGGGQWTALMTLLAGSTLVLYCEPSYDGQKICQLLQDEQAMVISLVGDAMARPLADCLATQPGQYDLSSLFVISSGGAILSKTVRAQLQALLPQTMIVEGFGASETGHNGSVVELSEHTDSPCFTLGPHTRVLDPQTLEAIPPGSEQAGLLARCGHIPLGYYNDDAKTAATFKTDANGTRWVIAGDWALVEADGRARLLGRGSTCINSGGEKIFPEEIEAALKACPDVFDAVVVGVPCTRFTEKVAAVIQPRDNAQPTLEELRTLCASAIAPYKLPRALVLVDTVARTPAGKPDYNTIKRTAIESLSAH